MNFKMKSYVTLPCSLLRMKQSGEMSVNMVTVIGYLLSVYSGYKGIQVSQKQIALRCGISVRTVKNIIDRLYKMNLINVIQSEWKGKREINVYIPQKPLLDMSGGFFYVPRKIFKRGLSPKLITVYFFMCHTQNYEYSKSWNSYNDIAARLRMKRDDVIKIIRELETLKLITKSHKIIRERGKGNRFSDNRYTVTWLVFFLQNKTAFSFKKNKRKAVSIWDIIEKSYLNDKNDKTNDFIKRKRIRSLKHDKQLNTVLTRIYEENPSLLHGFPF